MPRGKGQINTGGPVLDEDTSELEEAIKKCLYEKEFLQAIATSVGENIRRDMQMLSDMFKREIEEMKQDINRSNQDLQKLRSEIGQIKEDARKDIIRLEKKNEELEQYTRRNSLRIFNLEENKGEDCTAIVLNLFKNKLKINLDNSCVDRCHRTGRNNGTKPRGIIIKFTAYSYRNLVFQNKKLLKGTRIVIAEDLTKQRINLLKRVWDEEGFQNAWMES